MRFNCKKIISEEEYLRVLDQKRESLKMKAISIRDKYQEKAEKAREWHKVFLWKPTVVGDYDCRFLEYVERRFPLAVGPLDELIRDYSKGNGHDYEWKIIKRPPGHFNTKGFSISYGKNPEIEWSREQMVFYNEPEYRDIKIYEKAKKTLPEGRG